MLAQVQSHTSRDWTVAFDLCGKLPNRIGEVCGVQFPQQTLFPVEPQCDLPEPLADGLAQRVWSLYDALVPAWLERHERGDRSWRVDLRMGLHTDQQAASTLSRCTRSRVSSSVFAVRCAASSPPTDETRQPSLSSRSSMSAYLSTFAAYLRHARTVSLPLRSPSAISGFDRCSKRYRYSRATG